MIEQKAQKGGDRRPESPPFIISRPTLERRHGKSATHGVRLPN